MADDDYVQIDQDNNNNDSDNKPEDKDDYIKQLEEKIHNLEDTNKQQQFELQRAIHASYDPNDNNSSNGNTADENKADELDFTSMTAEEVGAQLLKTQKFLNTIKNERDRLQYQLADMKVADEKLRRRLSENFQTPLPRDNRDLAKFIQFMIAEEQMNNLRLLKEEKEKMELELKQTQFQMADEKYEKMRLEKEKILNEKRLEFEIAEARYNEIKLTQQVNEVAMASGAVTPTKTSLDPAELAKQLKDEMDKIKFRFAEEKLKVIELEKKVKDLENELLAKDEKISAMTQKFAQDGNSGNNDDLGQMQSNMTKQASHYIDGDGHRRDVSMPGFHKQFTMNFAEEINDLRASDLSGTLHVDGQDVNVDDPNMSHDLKRAYLEIQQLQKQLSQFTEQARDERALIWEKPRLTIQQISTFLRKLPPKHKEKMWERHCMGEYVKIDKVGSLLFSIVALCIKIHDRNVKTPQKGALLKKLEPYTKLLQSQIQQKEDPTGLTQDDFNESLHEWLLLPLPIENLLNSTDREKLESELFETKKQLIEKDKEIIKERRKSKIYQESLQNLERQAEDIEEKERRASQIMDEKDQLKLEIIEREQQLGEQKTRIEELEEQVQDLSLKLNKARDTDDETLPERQPNGHTYMSLDDGAHHIHMMQPSENPFEEEKIDYSVNDSNIVKSDIYLGWKRKAERLQEQLDEQKTRADRAQETNEELTQKMEEYQAMADAYRTLQADNSKWKEKVQTMTDEMNQFDRSHSDKNKPVRRESIVQLHSNMARGMVFAEAEHEKIVTGLEKQIKNLQSDCNYITNEYEKFKNEVDMRLEQLSNSKDREFREKMLFEKEKYENELNSRESQLNQVRNQLQAISKQLISSQELENENMRLNEEIDHMRRNKQVCMEAAAKEMNALRELINKFNKQRNGGK